jgi:hypothetical protein
MPLLNTYEALKLEIARWLNREDDPDIDDRAALFIELAESRIRRQQEWFSQMYSLTNLEGAGLTVTSHPVQLPDHVRTVTDLWGACDLTRSNIELLPTSAWRDLVASNNNAQGDPTKAVVVPQMDLWMRDDGGRVGPMLFLWPPPPTDGSFAIDFQFIRDVDPLSEDSTNNGLFLRYPDLYLYGALCESAPYYQHDDRLSLWESRYRSTLDQVNTERERAEFGSHSKRVRLPRTFG